MHDLSYFLGKSFFGDDGFQNMFVCQQTFNLLEFKGAYYVIVWKSKGFLKLFHRAFLPNIKYFE